MAGPISDDAFGNESAGSGNDTAYVAQLGRISGKLLSANLVRHGVDLAFDTNLLYLDVNNYRIGVNNLTVPTVDLDVSDTIRVRDNFIVNGSVARIDNIVFNTNGSITTEPGPIEFRPSGPGAYIELGRVLTTDFEIKDNYIRGLVSNADITMQTSGTGIVDLQATSNITGNLSVTGNINIDGNLSKGGNIIIGDGNDTVDINTDFTQSLIPGINIAYSLGAASTQWNTAWISGQISASVANIENVYVSDQTRINGHTISTINSNDDLTLTSLLGTVVIEELSFNNNVITNLDTTTPDQVPMQLQATGNGYIKFTDSNAMRIPVGSIAERVGKEVGETRWNTDLGYLECFDGTVWQVATGGGIIITPAIQQELSEIYALVFG